MAHQQNLNPNVSPAFLKSNPKKLKLVFYGDSPTCATGFGTVTRNVLLGLHATGKYDISVLGINYWGDPHNFPFPIWPTGTNQERDPYGRQKVMSMIPRMDFDILFFMQDTFILLYLPELLTGLKKAGRSFRSLCYFPIDGVPKKEWIEAIAHVDVPVTYTKFGYEECIKLVPSLKNRLRIVPHGVNQEDFFPIDPQVIAPFRKQYFGNHADKFIYMNLNRNQQRKDIPKTIIAFKEVHNIDPNTLLYMHMAVRDQGWNLDEVLKSLNLDITSQVLFPQNFGPNQGFPLRTLNAIYNASDCVVSTALGEGWGLSWIEAMATKTPVIMPNNTALTENITEDIGYLINSGNRPDLFTIIPWDNEVLRPVCSIEHLIELMNRVKNNKREAREKAENAFKYIMSNFTWDKHVVPQWLKLIEELSSGSDIITFDEAASPTAVIDSEVF